MRTCQPFWFESVSRLELEAASRAAVSFRPEMDNISEHTASLSNGRCGVMRRFDPGSTLGVSAGAVVFHIDGNARLSPEEDTLCRYLAEGLSLPVISVSEARPDAPLDSAWLADWFDWCASSGDELGVDPRRLVLGARGAGAGVLLSAIATSQPDRRWSPRGLFLLCGRYRGAESGHHDLTIDRPSAWPPTYIATTASEPDRTRSRRLSASLLDRGVEHWLVEWPGVTARCLDHLERIPEMERYIDAMATCLRGLLFRRTAGTESETPR